MAGWLFPMLAKLLGLNPLTAIAFSAGDARPGRARNVIRATGSSLTEEGLAYYSRDTAVSPQVAAAFLPHAERITLEGLDHLAHDEAPDRLCDIMLDWLQGKSF